MKLILRLDLLLMEVSKIQNNLRKRIVYLMESIVQHIMVTLIVTIICSELKLEKLAEDKFY